MKWIGWLAVAIALGLPAGAGAEATSIAVYVLARDAKFIGDGVGGVQVAVTDAVTGESLAQGRTEGGTGDTDRLMRRPRERGESLVTPETAVFNATLDIAAPTRVRIAAHGPLDYPDSANTVSASGWLLPGGDVQSWILEMPGLVVDLHDVPALVRRRDGVAHVSLKATVSMMCGCPLIPEGLWDADEFAIEAQLLRDGVPAARLPLRYAGEDSEFEGTLTVTEPGRYEALVTAFQARTGNAGAVRRSLVVD